MITTFLFPRWWTVSFFALFALLYCQAQPHFDGIACWGDSKTEGGQESGMSYPGILQELLQQEGYQIEVFNFGANGERTTEIMQRQGSYPFMVQPFTIPASAAKEVKIAINSRLRVPEAGCTAKASFTGGSATRPSPSRLPPGETFPCSASTASHGASPYGE